MYLCTTDGHYTYSYGHAWSDTSIRDGRGSNSHCAIILHKLIFDSLYLYFGCCIRCFAVRASRERANLKTLRGGQEISWIWFSLLHSQAWHIRQADRNIHKLTCWRSRMDRRYKRTFPVYPAFWKVPTIRIQNYLSGGYFTGGERISNSSFRRQWSEMARSSWMTDDVTMDFNDGLT